MTLTLFIGFFLVLYKYKKLSFWSSYIYSFVIFYPLLYVIITSCNLAGINTFSIQILLQIIFLLLSLRLNLPDHFYLEQNNKNIFYVIYSVVLVSIVFIGIDYTYDSLSYHIDGIYGYLGSNNLLEKKYYTHFWAQNYPKFWELLMSTVTSIFGKYFFYSYGILNAFIVFGFLPLVTWFTRKFGMHATTILPITFLFWLSPVIIILSPSWYNDIIYVFYLLILIFFTTEKINFNIITIMLFVFIGMINTKYSWFFIGWFIWVLYLLKNIKKLKISFLFLVPLFLLGFNHYTHNFITTGTPLSPFKNLSDIRTFENTLNHKPKSLQNGPQELIYSHILSPYIVSLIYLQKHPELNSTEKLYTLYEFHANKMFSYWSLWIFILITSITQLIIKRNKIHKKLFLSLIIVGLIYGLQSVKWEIRYFLYIPFFVSFLLFIDWENATKKYKLWIKVLIILQCIFSVWILIYFWSDRINQKMNYRQIIQEDFSNKKTYFFKDTDFKHLYYYFWEKYGVYPKIIHTNDLDRLNLKNAVIINDDAFHQNWIRDIKKALYEQKITYAYNKNLGFITE